MRLGGMITTVIFVFFCLRIIYSFFGSKNVISVYINEKSCIGFRKIMSDKRHLF